MSDDEEGIKNAYDDDDDQEGFGLEYSTHAEKRKDHRTNLFVSKLNPMVRRSAPGGRKRGRQSL